MNQATLQPPVKTACSAAVRELPLRCLTRQLTPGALDRISDERRIWESLFEADPDSSVTVHPDLLTQDLGSSKGSRHASHFITCGHDDEILAGGILFPKTSTTREVSRLGIRWNLHGHRLAGNRFVGVQDEKILGSLLETGMETLTSEGSQFLLVEDLEESSPLWNQFLELKSAGCHPFFPTGIQKRLWIKLPASGEEYWDSFRSKTRTKLRRKVRQFEGAKLVKVDAPDQVSEFLSDAHEISQKTWQSHQLGLRIKNNEEELNHFVFLAEQNALRSYVLYQNQTPVAFVVGHQFRDTFTQEEIGYDPEFIQSSPGTVLTMMMLEELFSDNCPGCFDFGLGDAEYKRTFSNHETTSANIWLFPPGLKTLCQTKYFATCQRMEKTIRNQVERFGLHTKIRHLLRRS